MLPRLSYLLLIGGISLMFANLVGLGTKLRAPEVDQYVEFTGTPTLPYRAAQQRLEKLAQSSVDPIPLVTEATRIFHEGIVHLDPRDVEQLGPAHFAMRVPLTENWILFALSYMKPDTYADYEFCHYQRALRRGVGRCGQQSLALVSFLSQFDIPTGFVKLGGHTVATAQVEDDQWYLLDADYGAVIPFDIAQAERSPSSVLPHYWNNAAEQRQLQRAFAAPDNVVSYGGPEARYARACPIEHAAYFLKWAIPALLLMLGALARHLRARAI